MYLVARAEEIVPLGWPNREQGLVVGRKGCAVGVVLVVVFLDWLPIVSVVSSLGDLRLVTFFYNFNLYTKGKIRIYTMPDKVRRSPTEFSMVQGKI